MSRNKTKPTTQSEPLAPTVSEWRSALEVALIDSSADGGMTSAELQVVVGVPLRHLQVRLKKLFKAGRLIVGRKMVLSMIGVNQPIATYRLKEKSK